MSLPWPPQISRGTRAPLGTSHSPALPRTAPQPLTPPAPRPLTPPAPRPPASQPLAPQAAIRVTSEDTGPAKPSLKPSLPCKTWMNHGTSYCACTPSNSPPQGWGLFTTQDPNLPGQPPRTGTHSPVPRAVPALEGSGALLSQTNRHGSPSDLPSALTR